MIIPYLPIDVTRRLHANPMGAPQREDCAIDTLKFARSVPGVPAALICISVSTAFLLITFDTLTCRTPPNIPTPSCQALNNSGNNLLKYAQQQHTDATIAEPTFLPACRCPHCASQSFPTDERSTSPATTSTCASKRGTRPSPSRVRCPRAPRHTSLIGSFSLPCRRSPYDRAPSTGPCTWRPSSLEIVKMTVTPMALLTPLR